MNVRLKNFLFIIIFTITLSSGVSHASNVYTSAPSYKYPYYAGIVKYDVLVSALNEMNNIRRLIGLPDVNLRDEYTRKAQHGAVLLDVTDTLTHTPGKPSDMNQDFYSAAYYSTTHSNLAQRYRLINGKKTGSIDLTQTIRDYMDDSDAYNISRVGHRRWLMNPRLKYTGFGLSTRRGYASAYVIEEFRSSRGNSDIRTRSEYEEYLHWLKWPVSYEFITWPVNRNFHPLRYFNSQTAWSVTLNSEIFDKCDIDSVKVKLTRFRDGRTWIFSKSQSDGYFNISDSGIAYDECIIFRPMDITGYVHNETWRAEITGLTRRNKTGTGNITYNVTFINS